MPPSFLPRRQTIRKPLIPYPETGIPQPMDERIPASAPRPSLSSELQGQLDAAEAPPSRKQALLQAMLQGGAIGAGALFGGEVGASGAASGVEAVGAANARAGEERRKSLRDQIAAARGREFEAEQAGLNRASTDAYRTEQLKQQQEQNDWIRGRAKLQDEISQVEREGKGFDRLADIAKEGNRQALGWEGVRQEQQRIDSAQKPKPDSSRTALEIWTEQNPGAPISEWLELNAPKVRPDTEWVIRGGQPLQITKGQARPGDRPYSATLGEPGRKMLSSDANRMADIKSGLADLETLRKELTPGATGAQSRLGTWLPDAVTEFTGLGSEAKQKNAVIARVKQVIGRTLEGGVLRREDEEKYKAILPTIGDPADIVAKKLDGLERAIKAKGETLLESLGSAGFNTSGFDGQEIEVIAPDGTPGTIPAEDWPDAQKQGYRRNR